MSSSPLLSLLASALPLFCGIWATLVGFEYIGKPVGAELNPNFRIRQRLYKICGPVMIGLALILVGKAVLQSPSALKWQRYAPAGAHFSVELPGSPVESVIDEEPGEYGPAKSHIARLQRADLKIVCFARYTPWPDQFPELTREQKVERLKQSFEGILSSTRGKLIEEKPVDFPAGPGRQFRIEMPGGAVSRFEALSLDRTDFLLMFTAPAATADSAIAERFFRSFKYEN